MADGRPMLFTLAECPQSEEVRQMVEAEGGALIPAWEEGAIHLVSVGPRAELPFPRPVDHPVYTYHFVLDSHNLGELQDLHMYELGKEEEAEESSPSKAFRSRAKFTVREEAVMREYMTKYPGPYTSVSYWTKATAYGLTVKRSADTLRDHCKRMLKGKTASESPPKQAEKPAKRPKLGETKRPSPARVSPQHPVPTSLLRTSSPRVTLPTRTAHSTPLHHSDSVISELANTPISLSSRFENSPALLVTVSKRGREVQDMDTLKRKCMREQIPDKFKSLVERCQERSKHPVEEAEVLQVLMQLGGNAEETEEYFAGS